MNNRATDNSQKFGKWMMYLTWIIALALASYFFQNWIDYKRNPNASLSSNADAPVILKQNSQGHYLATGTINQAPVVFLLDTGATSVVISSELANQLNLSKEGKAQVSTANGIITVFRTTLDSVSLGSLNAKGIDAYINPHGDSTVLLGMSFLKHLSILQQDNTLTLSIPK